MIEGLSGSYDVDGFTWTMRGVVKLENVAVTYNGTRYPFPAQRGQLCDGETITFLPPSE